MFHINNVYVFPEGYDYLLSLINDFFIFNFEKLLSIPIVILFFLSLKGIGCVFIHNNKFKSVTPLIGFGLIYLIILCFSLLKPGKSIEIFSYIFFIIGSINYIYFNKKVDFLNDLSKIIILSPLIFYAAFVREFSWDDYTHWLRFADYLYVNNHLPIEEKPYLWGHPRYVYGLSIIRYFPNVFLSELNINICGLLNVMFLSIIFDWKKILFNISDKEKSFITILLENSMVLPLIFFVLLCHNTKVIMNGNADLVLVVSTVSSIFFVVKKGILAKDYFLKFYISFFLLLIALISIKQVGIILVGIIYLSIIPAIIITYKNITNISRKDVFYHLIIITGILLVYQSWEFYADLENLGQQVFKVNVTTIYFDRLPDVINSIFNHIIHRPYSFIALIILCFYSFFKLSKELELRFLIISSLMFNFGLILFLILLYISIFNNYEGPRASSFNRYLMPAGVLSFAVFYLIYLDRLLKKITKRNFIIISTSLLIMSNILIMLNPRKFVRPILTNIEIIQKFILYNNNYNDQIMLVDEKNWRFGANLLNFNLRNDIKIDVSTNIDGMGKSTGPLKLNQISTLFKKYDKIFILPEKYNIERQLELLNNFKVVFPKNEPGFDRNSIFLVKKK